MISQAKSLGPDVHLVVPNAPCMDVKVGNVTKVYGENAKSILPVGTQFRLSVKISF